MTDDEHPLRRSTDTHTEANARLRHAILVSKIENATNTLYHYLIVTVCISMLVLIYNQYRVLQHINTVLTTMGQGMVLQNIELERIHAAIHPEGEKKKPEVNK